MLQKRSVFLAMCLSSSQIPKAFVCSCIMIILMKLFFELRRLYIFIQVQMPAKTAILQSLKELSVINRRMEYEFGYPFCLLTSLLC